MSSFPYTATTGIVTYQVTASDSEDLPGRITRLVIGTTGKIKFDTPHFKGDILSANQVAAMGEVLDFEVTKVHSTDTDASDIKAFGIFPERGPGMPHVPNAIQRESVDLADDGSFLLLEQPEFSRLIQE